MSGLHGGIESTIWLSKEMGRMQYEIVSREIGAVIPSYLREVLTHCSATEEGFEGKE